jgi:hypothetical protein
MAVELVVTINRGTFIYSYEIDTDKLDRTSLVTGERSCHQVPTNTFKAGSCWSEVPL